MGKNPLNLFGFDFRNPDFDFDSKDEYTPRYFTDAEMLRCSPPCHLSQMDPNVMRRLDTLREWCGFPIVINSAYRTVKWEHDHKRSGTSWHTKGLAVDIHCIDSRRRAEIIRNAFNVGFRGIGVAPTFIHLDLRPAVPNDTSMRDFIMWLYE